MLAVLDIRGGFVHQNAQLVLNGLELHYLYFLFSLVLAILATLWAKEAWIWILLLLHLHALEGEHLLPLLHEIHLHVHCFLEILVSEIKNLLESLLIHSNHLLLIIKKLVL